MATPDISVPLLLQAVRRRPEVWTTRPDEITDKRRAAAWKKICEKTWPEFNSWTVEQKRTRCLTLQKKWRTLQKDFMDAQKNGATAKRSAHHDLLTFLLTDKKPRREEGERARASKRPRTEPTSEECDEDRHFLLSLESYVREVPRSSKLALREDMLRLIRKYTAAPDDDPSTSTAGTLSQEY